MIGHNDPTVLVTTIKVSIAQLGLPGAATQQPTTTGTACGPVHSESSMSPTGSGYGKVHPDILYSSCICRLSQRYPTVHVQPSLAGARSPYISLRAPSRRPLAFAEDLLTSPWGQQAWPRCRMQRGNGPHDVWQHWHTVLSSASTEGLVARARESPAVRGIHIVGLQQYACGEGHGQPSRSSVHTQPPPPAAIQLFSSSSARQVTQRWEKCGYLLAVLGHWARSHRTIPNIQVYFRDGSPGNVAERPKTADPQASRARCPVSPLLAALFMFVARAG